MFSTQIRRIPLLVSILVMLFLTLVLSLALLFATGALRPGNSSSLTPKSVVCTPATDPNGVICRPVANPNGLACGVQTDPNGQPCQQHTVRLVANGPAIDGNGHS
jgi:hypothetical protein